MVPSLPILAAAIVLLIGAILMSEAIDRLTASVTALTNVSASAVTLITGLAAEIRSLNEDGDEEGLDALADRLDASAADLSAAITANTPVATSPGVQPDPSVPPVTPEPAPAEGEEEEQAGDAAKPADPG